MEICLACGCSAEAWRVGRFIELFQAAVRDLSAHFFPVQDRADGEISRADDTNRRAEEILKTYGNSILRYAYSYLHNMSDAEEVLQDTLVQFLKTAPVFETRQHEKAWLLRVAGNLSKNRLDYSQKMGMPVLSVCRPVFPKWNGMIM